MSISLTMLCVSIANTVGIASRSTNRPGEPEVMTFSPGVTGMEAIPEFGGLAQSAEARREFRGS
jgi:hypothetical protein